MTSHLQTVLARVKRIPEAALALRATGCALDAVAGRERLHSCSYLFIQQSGYWALAALILSLRGVATPYTLHKIYGSRLSCGHSTMSSMHGADQQY